MADELKRIQRAVGEVLIPEARQAQTELFSEDQTFPVALELFYAAFAMKKTYRPGALFIAKHYAGRMGLDAQAVEAFALHRLNEAASDER